MIAQNPTYAERVALIDANEEAMKAARLAGESALSPSEGGADRGPTGGASVLRRSRIKLVEGRSGGSGNAPTIKTEVRRYECECKLDYLRTRGTIDRNQWSAGMIFRRSWLATRTGAIRIANLASDRAQHGEPGAAANAHSDARFRIDEAARLLTPDEFKVVCAVAGEDEALGQPGARDRTRGERLKVALSKLAVVWA